MAEVEPETVAVIFRPLIEDDTARAALRYAIDNRMTDLQHDPCFQPCYRNERDVRIDELLKLRYLACGRADE